MGYETSMENVLLLTAVQRLNFFVNVKLKKEYYFSGLWI